MPGKACGAGPGLLLAVTCLFATLRSACPRKDPQSTLINKWPMLMAHDAATTFLEEGLLHPIGNWAKTQPSGGLPRLLECGARIFDWRPMLLLNGTVAMHHGFDIILASMDSAVDGMLAWAEVQNATAENLSILGLSDCTCEDKSTPCQCWPEVLKLLESKKIPHIASSELQKGLTVAEVVKIGERRSGSPVVSVSSWEANYDSSVTCSGFVDNKENSKLDSRMAFTNKRELPKFYTCYADSRSKAFPLNRMFSYIANVTANAALPSKNLSTVQCLWQENAASVVIGTLHGSSLLQDESRSQLNAILRQRIENRVWNVTQIGIIEINNVCDGGPELLKAFREAA